MNYYGMSLDKNEQEYQDDLKKREAESKHNIVPNLICPECNSQLYDDGKHYVCTNQDCTYKYEKPEEKTPDFWEYDPSIPINIGGVGRPRTANDISLNSEKYNLVIAAIVLYGLTINAIECIFLKELAKSINPLLLLIGYYWSCFKGIALCLSEDDLRRKFLGYNMVVVPLGILLTIYVDIFDPYLVGNAICLTAGFTLTMMMFGYYFPKVFADLGQSLLLSLIAVIIGDFCLICGFGIIDPDGLDILASFIFCMYIGYDWGRAQHKECTVYNALEVALNMYLDIINLFIRILSLLGRKRD